MDANIEGADALLNAIGAAMPVAPVPYAAPERTGLLVIDVVDGFCTPGCGPLAPPAPDADVERMVAAIDAVARRFLEGGRKVMALRDQHAPGRAEPPYPPHCEAGSGHELLVERLRWLGTAPGATVLPKDCISAAVGTFDGARNALHDWITDNRLQSVVVVGICTDICVLDVVTALLSARNHYVPDGQGGERPMLGDLRDVVVYEPACATYDLPLATARALGLPDTAAHPRAPTHHVGLYVMQGRGAVIASSLA